MTLNEFCAKLREAAPLEFDAAQHMGIEIYFSDGHCSVKYGDKYIANADCGDPGGWDKALDAAIAWLAEHAEKD